MYRILSTNAQEVKNKGLDAKTKTIDIAVLESDIENNNPNPVFYAYRYGMYYNPYNDFKPNIVPNHKINEELIGFYHDQLQTARQEYNRILSTKNSGPNNSGEIIELQNQLNQKQIRINEQAKQIKELSSKGPEKNNGQIDQLKQMIETLSAVQSNRIEIKIGDKPTKIIEKVVHEKFKDILSLLSVEEAVYMYGPAGTGKSELAKQVAEALELEFYPASTITQEFKLTGYKDANGLYHETNFYKAMKKGGLFFLDEMDSCSPDVLVSINGALANGYFDFPNGTLYAHKDFRVIAAGNTIGRGGDAQYTGRFALDASTLDRFLGVKIDYSLAIDNIVSNNDKDLVSFAHALRKTAEENEIIILMSYRSISKIAKLQKMDFSLVEVINMALIKGIASDDIRMLTRNMSIDSSNKYYKALKQAV